MNRISQRSYGAVAVLNVRDCRAHWEGRSSNPRAWAGMARHPGASDIVEHTEDTGLASCALSVENLSRQ